MGTKLSDEKYHKLAQKDIGLGGWLVLVQIGLYYSFLTLLVRLFRDVIPLFSSEELNQLTSKESEFYHPLWRPLITFEILYTIGFILFIVFVLFNFYRKKSILPSLMITLYIANLFAGIMYTVLSNQIPLAADSEDGSSYKQIFQLFITCAIWVPYFMKSYRVKNTFVR